MITTAERGRLDALEGLNIWQTEPDERFDRVTRMCQRLFGVPLAFVNLVGADQVFTKSCQGLSVTSTPREQTFCGTAVGVPGGLVVEDATQDPRFAGLGAVVNDPGVRFYAGVPLAAPGGQLVGTLCILDTEPRSFTDEDLAVLQDLAVWVQKELNLDEELDRAAEVQRAMFPRSLPRDAGWDIAGACRPSREVGGDFYDWYSAIDGTVITVGDVMGKGMPAAILMASVRSTLRLGAHAPTIGSGLTLAARALAPDLQATRSFATVLLARLEADGAFSCADAGHGHAAIVRVDGTVQTLDAGGLPLGIDASEPYDTYRHRLKSGDLLLLHSDGLIELDGGPRSTAEAAAGVVGCTGADEALDRLFALVGETPPSDDVTAVVARCR